MQMIDLPAVYEAAYRTRNMQYQLEQQNKARSLDQVMNDSINPQTGAIDPAAARRAAAAKGVGFQVEQVLAQMDTAQRARLKEQLEEMDTRAMGLADEYNRNMKEDPRTADAKLQESYDKMVVNTPDLYALKQQGKLPAKVNYSMLVGMMGKHADVYEKIQEIEATSAERNRHNLVTEEQGAERNRILNKGVNKRGTTAKTLQEDKDNAALAAKYGTTVDEVRAVKKSYKTLAEENFPKALAISRLEKPADGGKGSAMSEADARKALSAKGVTGADADEWIKKYKAAGKVQ